MGEPVFLLDANVFIEAARRYYAFDLVPRFWDSLVEYASLGRIRSIDRVKHELERGKDELASWVEGYFQDAFASTDEDEVVQIYKKIIKWVNSESQFTEEAKATFAGGADGWLVAYAKVKGCIVVTQEISEPFSKRKVKIPDVCIKGGLSFLDTFEMLRTLGIRLG
ncbi:MAG TPA: DUF4411 family protein [bacterium]|nr:DUF4411 family protein [bacterium]